jgi:hypothetical protein
MNRTRLIIIGGVVLLGVIVLYERYRRSPDVQVPATFARLAQAFADHDAADVLACVDRSYDFSGKWPEVFPDPATARGLAQRDLGRAFLFQAQEPIAMTWTLHHQQPMPDGSIRATVSLRITGGLFSHAIPELRQHQFILRRGSLLTGRYRILDHAPFTLSVPSP